jgi:hypothetical protein
VVVGIDQVDAIPRLTANKKPLMHITCHGKRTLLSIFNTKLSEPVNSCLSGVCGECDVLVA